MNPSRCSPALIAWVLNRWGQEQRSGTAEETVEDEPALPDVPSLQEWPRSIVAGFEATARKLGRKHKSSTCHYLKIRFTGGSALELEQFNELELEQFNEESDGLRLVDMSCGRA